MKWWRRSTGSAPKVAQVFAHRFAHRLQNSRYESGAPGETLIQVGELAASPRWVRLLFFNDRLEPWRLDAAGVAQVENVDRLPTAWRTVTFPSGSAATPDGPMSGETERLEYLELPENGREVGRPELRWSDWIELEGSSRVLAVRATAACGVRFSGSVGRIDRRVGISHRGYRVQGDGAPVRDDKVFAAYGVEAITAERVATVVGIGDSIMHSSCSTGELSGFGVRAAARVSGPKLRVSYVNEGYPGRNSIDFCGNGDWWLRHARPQVTLIQTWTQNELWTRAAAEAAFARAIALADQTRRCGGVPVLATSAPVFADNAEADRHRAANVEMVRTAAGHGMLVLDLDRLWGTGAVPNAYRRDCGCGDGMHPSDEGCMRAATALVPMLRTALGL